MKLSHYFTLAQAEELRKIFLSWIGKKAHIGAGYHETLKDIAIREGQEQIPSEKRYLVEFIFENNRSFGAYEFSVNNGLKPSSQLFFEG